MDPKTIDSAKIVNADDFRSNSYLPNLVEAQRFLDLLEPDVPTIFSSFDDNAEREKRRLAKREPGVPPDQCYGQVQNLRSWIAQRQTLGANICVTIQAMKGRRRRASDVSYIRAIFAELDQPSRKPFPLEPSIINETSAAHTGKQHVYWLVDPEHPITVEEFEGIQRRLVEDYGADAGARDVARTLRLPGTWNLKPGREPHQVRIAHATGARYSRAGLLEAFPPAQKVKAKSGPKPNFGKFRGREKGIERFIEPLNAIPADEYPIWLEVGMAIHDATGGSTEGLRMWDAWSARSDKWSRGECEYRWKTFSTGKGITGGTIFALAEMYGYQKPAPKRDWRSDTIHDGPSQPEGAAAETECDAEPQSSADNWLPTGFRRKANGHLEFLAGQAHDGEDDWQWLSSPIEIVAETSDERDREHGRLIRIHDSQNNRFHEWAMPMRLLAGDPGSYRGEFLSMGAKLGLTRKAKEALGGLIQNATPARKLRCVSRMGWHSDNFVLPDRTLGGESDRGVVFQSNRPVPAKFASRGTLEDWKTHVGKPAQGNSRLMIGIMAGFAGPSLKLAKQEGGGFHFWGDSSGGKTTTLRVAGSVWGGGGINGFLENWTNTTNALEGRARIHSDTLLCLQELGQADPDAAADAAYKLANGCGKGRMSADAELRETSEWRVLFLSDGEITLDDKIRESRRGGRRMAGQAVRVIDIMADAGKGHGAFDHIADCASGREFSENLVRASEQYYGTAAPAYLERLTADIAGATERIKSTIDAFVNAHASSCGGQVERVAKRFALLAACGELATRWAILPWLPGDATNAARRCFLEWLEVRGTRGPAELERGLEQVRRVIELHGTSRFQPWDEPGKPIIGRLGFVRYRKDVIHGSEDGQVFYVLPEGWKEICTGCNPTNIAKELINRGILMPEAKTGKATSKPYLPGLGATRCYVIDAQKLFDDGGHGGHGGHDE